MISFRTLSSEEIAGVLAMWVRGRRLGQNLTLEGLARRSGVALGTLKKFERTGKIALISFIKLLIALKQEAALEGLMMEPEFDTLEQVLKPPKKPKRGRIT